MTGSSPDDLIIERPDLQSWPVLLGSRTVTAIMWALYVYLWLPLLTLIGWALGVDQAYQQMVELGGYLVVISLWLFFGSVILIMGGVLLLWARINFYRFRGTDRRRVPGLTDSVRMATDFGLAAEQLQTLQSCRRAVLGHRPDGTLQNVRIGFTSPSAGAPEEALVALTTQPVRPDPGPMADAKEPGNTVSQ